MQVESGVLHVDKGGIEPGKADDLDDLRVGDAAGMRAEREPACIHDPFDPVLLHRFLLSSVAQPVCARINAFIRSIAGRA